MSGTDSAPQVMLSRGHQVIDDTSEKHENKSATQDSCGL